ncbi:MAG: oligopeptide:H+ symporter [Propionibacteriaceae bacterium]|nr:oligopeptide:H+ symporter [Propionibacteriaceae bacterium]
MATPADQTRSRTFLGHPLGLVNLFSTELCERFSFYGMKAILVYYLYDSIPHGGLGLSETDAMVFMSLFGSLVYLTSIVGGWLADRVLGPFRTVLIGGVTIAAGHVVLGFPLGLAGTLVALSLIIAGTGLLKPNVSVMVGQLYAAGDPRRQAGFTLLYLSINIGSFISPLLVGWVSDHSGYHAGFLIPAVFMIVALVIYVGLSRRTLAGIGRAVPQPLTGRERRRWAIIGGVGGALVIAVLFLVSRHGDQGLKAFSNATPILCVAIAALLFAYFLRDVRLDAPERSRIAAYAPLFIAGTCFFAISEQQGSTMALVIDQDVVTRIGGFDIPNSWFQSINPLVIIVLSPLLAGFWTRLGGRQPSPVTKIGAGLVVAAAGFAVLATPYLMGQEQDISPAWVVAAMVLITLGELLLAPTGLAVTSQLSPSLHISKMMALWFIADALGQGINALTVHGFDPLQPEGFFLAYGAVALLAGLAVMAARKPLIRLARGAL